MKLSERFDRRYQQTPATAPQTPVAAPPEPVTGPLTPVDGTPSIAPVERRAAARDGAAAQLVTEQRSTETTPLSPALAAAKAEIHADLLRRHAAAIDITNRAGIRRLLLQLTEAHFRAKPPAALPEGFRGRVTKVAESGLVELSIGVDAGLEKGAVHPGVPLIPDATIDCGSAPGCMPPRRMRAPIIGCGVPRRRAEPASARNSRWRENHMTMIEARIPNTIWLTITVM